MQKKVTLLGVVIMAAMLIIFSVGCKKDDKKTDAGSSNNRKVKAIVENGNDYNSIISTVKYVMYEYDEDGYLENGHVISSCSFDNGGFTMDLPETVNGRYLYSVEWFFNPDVANISDMNVGLNYGYFEAYDEDDDYFDDFLYAKFNNKTSATRGEYWYADRNVTITGEGYDGKGDLSLKKGWNLVYHTFIGDDWFEYSSQKVPDLLWYLWDDFWEDDKQVLCSGIWDKYSPKHGIDGTENTGQKNFRTYLLTQH